MKAIRLGILACALVLLNTARVPASLVFYTSEAAFDAASTALSTQTFATATLPAAGYSVFGNPLDGTTSNSTFSAGSILPGLSISSSADHKGQDLVAVAPGLFGNTNNAIYNNFGGDSLNTTFSSPVTAVGMGLLNPNGTSVSFVVDSTGGGLLGSHVVTVTSAGPSVFFGVIATGGDQVGQIDLLGQATNGDSTERFAGMDRIVFGSAVSVPEPASALLLAAGASLAAFAGRVREGKRPRSRREGCI